MVEGAAGPIRVGGVGTVRKLSACLPQIVLPRG